MMRRAKLIGLLSLVAVLAAFGLAQRPDGLEWIRAYGGTEASHMQHSPHDGEIWVEHKFFFSHRPTKLAQDVLDRSNSVISDSDVPEAVQGNFGDGWTVLVDLRARTAFAYRRVEQSWFQRQWRVIRRFFGQP